MQVYEVSVECEFSAKHSLELPEGQWEEPHEHLWRIRATFRTRRLKAPMNVVVDFVELKETLDKLSAEFAGSNLNKHPEFANDSPSAECVARWFADKLLMKDFGATLQCVGVVEAPGCIARYYPDMQ